jgi:putative tricarboxylic transport membrane protein
MAAGMLMFLGIFLNSVGMEMVQYSQRYTFGIDGIISGIALIPVLIGLFALSQAFVLLVNPDNRPELPEVRGGMLKGLLEIFRFPKVVTSSAGFGVVMGIIPGVGEFLAQFFSYSLARVFSKNPDQFGKGAPEGIIASEAANNAVPAAAMIPLLSLGIPGEVLTAMMLSVFYVHNIIPGPTLFQTRPEFPVSLYICLLVVNIVILIFLLCTTNKILHIIRIPTRFLGVFILTLGLIGVYSIRNSFVDCIIAVIFGIAGYVLKRLKLPVVPIILGMVLGRIMDDKLRSGMARIETPLDLINRPISGTIFALIVLVMLLHFVALYRQRRSRSAKK